MNTTWWVSADQLDPAQQDFMNLPPEGKFKLVGPPGSGKTNLLLLRARYIAVRRTGPVLFLTFTRELCEFVRAGLPPSDNLRPEQVMTYMAWARHHILEYGGSIANESDFNRARQGLLDGLRAVRSRVPSANAYSAILIDEAQDFTADELRELENLTSNVCIAGDPRQAIYNDSDVENALGAGSYVEKVLHFQYRVGHEIARVADAIIQPDEAYRSLESISNYNERDLGPSRTELLNCGTVEDQFSRLSENLSIQLDAFPKDSIGIIVSSKDRVRELYDLFASHESFNQISFHIDGGRFGDGRRVHVLPAHTVKGAEFRAVHIFAAQDFREFPYRRTKLVYTIVTRAKTSLHIYTTGVTQTALQSAYQQKADFGWRDLLGES